MHDTYFIRDNNKENQVLLNQIKHIYTRSIYYKHNYTNRKRYLTK